MKSTYEIVIPLQFMARYTVRAESGDEAKKAAHAMFMGEEYVSGGDKLPGNYWQKQFAKRNLE